MFRYIMFVAVIAMLPEVASAQFRWYAPRPYYYYNYQYFPQPQVYRSPTFTEKQLYDRKIEGMKAREQYEDYVKSSALERKEKELENAQKWQALKQKEDYLRSKGYLPPKPVAPPFVYNGVSYANWAEFKNSKAYTEEYLKDLEEKGRAVEEERRLAKEREQYVIKKFAEISRLTPSQKDAMKNKDSVLRSLESDITSGKYSQTEVQKMLDLWKNLQ